MKLLKYFNISGATDVQCYARVDALNAEYNSMRVSSDPATSFKIIVNKTQYRLAPGDDLNAKNPGGNTMSGSAIDKNTITQVFTIIS